MPARALRWPVLSVLLTLVVAPIAFLPYSADDLVNRNWALLPWSDSIGEAVEINKHWMFEQGRFFPGGAVYGIPLWHLFDSRAAYGTYLVLLNLVCVALVGFIAWKVSRSARIGALAVVVLGACMQLRFDVFDGMSSFGGLVVFTVVLTLVSGILAAWVVRGGPRWLAGVTALLWLFAVTAYEISLLMLPAIILVLVAVAPPRVSRRTWAWSLLPLLVPALLQAAVTGWLRAGASAVAPAYQIDLGGPVGTTFAKQLTAALPSAQFWLPGAAEGVRLPWGMITFLVVVLGIPAFALWRPWSPRCAASPRRMPWALAAAGAWAWVVPSVVAGVTRRWQQELPWGQGYVYLVYEFVGLSLMVAGVTCWLCSSPRRARWATVVLTVVFAASLVACVITIGSNIVDAGRFVPGPQGPG